MIHQEKQRAKRVEIPSKKEMPLRKRERERGKGNSSGHDDESQSQLFIMRGAYA